MPELRSLDFNVPRCPCAPVIFLSQKNAIHIFFQGDLGVFLIVSFLGREAMSQDLSGGPTAGG